MKNILILIFFFFSLINNSWSKSPSEFISSLTDEASIVLSSKLTDEEKIVQLKKIGENSVDIDGVGLYTLGDYRKTLNENQKEQYKDLFKKYFLKSFSNRLVGYSDAKIAVLSEEVKNEKYKLYIRN